MDRLIDMIVRDEVYHVVLTGRTDDGVQGVGTLSAAPPREGHLDQYQLKSYAGYTREGTATPGRRAGPCTNQPEFA